jgi:bifunctional UDP-N-acetylglucosamine pyrophosphorylase/glucosamine-1-phosphate N-acetyltransferase
MQAVILAAGKGTRMSPITETRPKPLVPVAGELFIKHQIRKLPREIDEVIVVIGYKGDLVKKVLGSEFEGRKIKYVEQKQQLGTGHALIQAGSKVSGDFLCLVGDHIWGNSDLSNLIKKGGVIVMGRKVNDVSPYGYLEIEGNKLKKIIEKPKGKKSGLVNISAYRFELDIFDALKSIKPSPRGEIELVDAVTLLAQKGKVSWLECKEWVDFSKPWHILEVNEFLMENLSPENRGEISSKATVIGRVRIGEGTIVLPGAYIEGPVVIGKNCLIGPNCFIRPSTSIGDNCHVGNAVEIKNSVIFSNTKIPHLNYVGDSVIGEGCNLGAGTKIANLMHNGNVKMEIKGELVDTGRRKLGAVIGDSVKTGINTSIYPGRKLGPNSFTDVAAVVKRNLPQGHILMNSGELNKI